MRTTLLLLLSLLTIFVSAQTWTEQTSNTTAELVAIHFYDSSTGVAVGGAGTVVSTTNMGETWTPSSAGADYDMLCADFTSDIIYAGGEMTSTGDGFIIKSTNRGQNWTPQTTTLPERILGISFTDASHGWAGGRKGLLLKTMDGGQNWTDGNSPTGEDISAVFFWDANTGWIADEDGFIYHTSNGGTSWTTQSTGADKDLYDIQFINANEGLAGGKNANLLHSVDGGANWNAQAATQEDVMAIHMLSNDNSWVAATGGEILQTNDAGTNWINTGNPAFGELADIFMIHDSLGWVCGAAGLIAKLEPESGNNNNNLNASFTAPAKVCVGEEITLTDESTGNVILSEWEMGDGTDLSGSPISHTYQAAGQYTIILTVEDNNGNESLTQSTIEVVERPEANFTQSLDTIDLSKGNSVMFTNLSANADDYLWEFGNGNTSQATDPIATYNSIGNYNIQLIAGNVACADTVKSQVIVVNRSATGVDFNAVPQLTVFPNPANDQIFIQTDEMVTGYVLMDLLGKIVDQRKHLKSPSHESLAIEVASHPEGIYLLSIETTTGQITRRIKITNYR